MKGLRFVFRKVNEEGEFQNSTIFVQIFDPIFVGERSIETIKECHSDKKGL